MEKFWAEFGQTIISNLMEFSVYLIIIVIFCVAFAKCIMPVVRSRNCLRKAARKLRRSQERDIWQDKGFLGKRSPLSAHWNAYLNSRLFANDEYHNASPLDDYINEDTAIYEPGFSTLADSVPSIMVSLGFLGTLLGIVMGLSDIDMGNADMMMVFIGDLLRGMKYAFTTSIVGVVASLAFQVLQRWAQNSTRHALVAFQDAMRTEARVVTVDPMTQITIYQQEQTAQLQAIAEEITVHMGEKLTRAIEASLTPVAQSMDRFITAATREQIRGVDLIVNNFVARMNESLNGQFRNLSSSIEETCRWHRETQETVRATIDGMNRVSRDIVEIQQMSQTIITRFENYLTRLGAAQQQIESGFESVTGSVRSMENVSRQQVNYISQIRQMQEDFMREISTFHKRMDSFTNAYVEKSNLSAAALQKASEDLRASGESMKENGRALIASHETFTRSVHTELQQAYGIFDANLTESVDKMKRVIDSIGEGMKNVPQVMGEAAAQYAEEMDQLIAYMQQIGSMLEGAMGVQSDIQDGGAM